MGAGGEVLSNGRATAVAFTLVGARLPARYRRGLRDAGVFLAGDRDSYVNGTEFPIGGRLAVTTA